MAIIYTYPTVTPSGADNIIGTQIDPATEENRTVQFNLGAVNSLATQNYLETTVTVTAAQVKDLNSNNVLLIAAQGLNKWIKVLEVTMWMDYQSAQYAASQPLNIGSDVCATIAANRLTGNTDMVYSPAILNSTLQNNTAVYLWTDNDPTNGNSPLQFKIRYQVLDTSSSTSF
jgi:hypothetical protein